MIQKIKLVLVGIAGLFLLFTVIGLLMPSSVKISRGIILEEDSAYVHKVIRDITTWQEWMVWLHTEDGILISSIDDSGVAGIQWRLLRHKEAGQITLNTKEKDQLLLHLSFPGLNPADGAIHIRQINRHQTELLWMLEYPLKWYPWERFEGIFMDAMIGQSLEQSLKFLEEKLKIVSSGTV